jgi:hypothetical protein
MHPYKALADRHFWSRAVSKRFDANDVATLPYPLLKAGQQIMSAGSCFAATLVPYLEKSGFRYVRTNDRHPDFEKLAPENFSYDSFSASYGNMYTARHLLQLTRRCLGKFSPLEDRWHIDGAVVDPFRPGLRYAARSDREFDLLTAGYLHSVTEAFERCDAFIFTLGLTEAWRSKADGAVFPACPGTIAGTFDSTKHELVNFGVRDVVEDMNSFVAEVREINPSVRIILTVSPVPMIATATKNHVLAATSYTKSVLRAAAEEVVLDNEEVFYFPFYEIVTGPQAPKSYFGADRRSVSPEAVKLVMSLFFGRCETRADAPSVPEDRSSTATRNALTELSSLISAAECEEAGQDS